MFSGAYIVYAIFASSDIPGRPVLWHTLMSVTNILFGAFGVTIFVLDKYLENPIGKLLLPFAQVANLPTALFNAIFLYQSYNTPEVNPFSDPRYVYIYVMNELLDIAGLVWGSYTAYKQILFCDICDPQGECYDMTAQCLAV